MSHWKQPIAMKPNESSTTSGQILHLDPKDQWKPIDYIRNIVFFILRHPVREDILRTSLDNLIRNHLPILGSKIQSDGKQGGLFCQLPTPSHDGLLFGWSSRRVQTTLAASQLLPASNISGSQGVIWGKSIVDLEKEWTPTTWPRARYEDKPDTATFLVHLTKYEDATVVCTNIPHAIVDQLGFSSFVRAWLQVARGEKPAQFLQLERGALDGPKDISEKELQRKATYRVTTAKERAGILLGFIPELILQPSETRRLLVFPEDLIANLREKHQAKIALTHGTKLQLTNGDIVAALLLKAARGRHPALMAEQPYLHNAIMYSTAHFSISRDTSVCDIAYHNRLAVIEALKPENVDRAFAVTREIALRGYSIHTCEPGELSFTITNWTAAWHGIDFSTCRDQAAGEDEELVADPEQHAEPQHLPTPSPLVFGHSLPRGRPTRCKWDQISLQASDVANYWPLVNAQIMCKAEGGYWCDFTSSTKNMALVDQLMSVDPLLESI
ncbi:hypothetical protein GCG54_00015450 [Colletotrichum gloeosporioides]|uniref:Transferase n=1 Tax=Colletotrichum gloeosporioides TaxID=474922 RepID=A0A8H4FF49_COLGL|nr:uncharacterized protein GCG54_00015450 [Colletotrichum gloeosporioides]KAF3800072.1 hypothetical protein GCG54_00015450 [Colletotrichum gloeosporioides]